MKGVLVVAVVTSIVQSLIFFLYAATYSLGAFLVVDGRAVYNQIFVYINNIIHCKEILLLHILLLQSYHLYNFYCHTPWQSHVKHT